MDDHRFCGQCGSEIKNGERFCGTCGKPVEDFAGTGTPVPAAVDSGSAMGSDTGSTAPVPPAVSEPTTSVASSTEPAVPAATNPTPVTPVVPGPVAATAPANDLVNNQTLPGTLATPIASGKKINKKLLIFGGVGAVAAILVAVVVAVILNLPKTRTFMVYMIGSNLESEYAAGSLDINEMIGSDFDPEYSKVIIYTGGSKKWRMSEISADENAIFEVSKDGLNKVKTFEKKVMTNPEVLTEFLDFGYENYKSDLYDLVLWDHGGGPIIGYGLDENSSSESSMQLAELSSAIEGSKLIQEKKKFEFIGFDACLMGSIEVGSALKNYSNYMIASEESEPGWGWNYAFLGSVNGKTTAEELGTSVVDTFISQYDDYPYKVSLSLAMTKLSELDNLTTATNELFNQVNAAVSTSNFSDYSRTMTRDRVYGYDGRDDESYDLVDLKDLASALEAKHPNEAKALEEKIDKAVVVNKTNMSSTNGVSIYFPTNNKEYLETFLKYYKDVTFSSDYYSFLTKYSGMITGKNVVSKSAYPDLKETKSGKTVSVELPDELVENYQKAEVRIFRKLDDNKYMPVYLGSDVSLSGNTLSTDSTDLQFVVHTKDGETGEKSDGLIALYETMRTEEYTEYTSFGVLYYNDDSALGFSSKNYEMVLRVDKGSKTAEVRNIKVPAEDGISGKISFEPKNIKILEMTVGAYKLFDDNGNYLDEMKGSGTLYGTSVNLEDGGEYEIKLENLDYDFKDMYDGEFKGSLDDYYAEFIVYDTQGEGHRLNLIHIN